MPSCTTSELSSGAIGRPHGDHAVGAAPQPAAPHTDVGPGTKPRPRRVNSFRALAKGCTHAPIGGPGPVLEKPYRSMVKAISWRVTGTFDTVVISWLITGELKWALSIGFVELFTKVALYYLHERVWNRVSLGRVKAPLHDYEI